MNRKTVNRHPETGIRYGIISIHHLQSWIWAEAESIYLDCDCVEDECKCEPIGHKIESDGLHAHISEYGEVWIYQSPYVMLCRDCSPCAPNAGDLSAPDDSCEPAYTLPPEYWAEDSVQSELSVRLPETKGINR